MISSSPLPPGLNILAAGVLGGLEPGKLLPDEPLVLLGKGPDDLLLVVLGIDPQGKRAAMRTLGSFSFILGSSLGVKLIMVR